MGSSTSKAASSTAKTASKLSSKPVSATRRYPTPSPQTTRPSRPTAQAEPPSAASAAPDGHINSSASPLGDTDPDLNPAHQARLQHLGAVQPKPTLSHSSTYRPTSPSLSQDSQPPSIPFQPSASAPSQSIFPSASSNPAVSLLTARYRLAEEAEREFEDIGRKGAGGRRFVDVFTLKQALVMRERGMSAGQIEQTLELREGVVGALGRRGVLRGAS